MLLALTLVVAQSMPLVAVFCFCRFDSFVDFCEDMRFVLICVSSTNVCIFSSRKTGVMLPLLRSLMKSSVVEIVVVRSHQY